MRKIEREPNGRGIFAPGQDLVVAGAIAKKGARAAVDKKQEVLEARFSALFMRNLRAALDEKLNLTSEMMMSAGATEWEYIEEGGILAALWNISGAYEQGITFSLLKFPVKQEIIEVCELLDLNPYRLWSGECVLLAADHGEDMVQALAEHGVRAAVIGKVEKGIARKMTGVGGTGYLERPQPDEIYKLTEEV
ncbi:MAG: AIR synthase [Lachnospiraceae bacterium]|nr:AIR synthase [Lachnospiraceae bacterium]